MPSVRYPEDDGLPAQDRVLPITTSDTLTLTRPPAQALADVRAASRRPGAALPFDVLEAKLHPPPSPPGAITRTPLLNRLRSQRPRAVSMLAPPGYGKTTVAAQWASRDERSLAWLSLDARDNAPLLLLRHLATALSRAGVIDRPAVLALRDPGPDLWASAVPRLLNAVAAAPRPFLLVLDDADRIGGAAADVLVALVEAAPADATVVLIGRSATAVGLSRLRAVGALQVVAARDLAFTPREVKLRAVAAGHPLDEPALSELHRATEGWPIAVDLGLRALDDADAGAASVEREIADYLAAEVLTALPDEQRSFLRRTSVLDILSAPLCDAVLGSRDAAAQLDELDRDGRFLIPLDRSGDTFRYHPLLRAALRRDLRTRDAAVVDGLYRRAGRWFQRHGDLPAAVPFALAADDHAHAAALIVATGASLSAAGRGTIVIGWLDELAGLVPLADHPAAATLGGWVQALEGHAERAEECLAAAEQGVAAGRGDAATAAAAAVLRAALCLDPAVTIDARVTPVLLDLVRGTPRFGLALTLRGVGRGLAGEHAAADADLAAAARSAAVSGSVTVGVLAIAERSLFAAQAGDLATSDQLAFEAAELVRRGAPREPVAAALVHALVAAALLRQGRWDGARAELVAADRAAVRLTHALPWLTVQVRLAVAAAYLGLRDRGAAETQLAEAERVLELRPLTAGIAEQSAALRREVDELPDPAAHGTAGLTRAELRLLPLLATHLSFREIGEHLFVSRNTVKTQAISIYRKLGATSRSGTIARAAELGLVDADALHADRTI